MDLSRLHHLTDAQLLRLLRCVLRRQLLQLQGCVVVDSPTVIIVISVFPLRVTSATWARHCFPRSFLAAMLFSRSCKRVEVVRFPSPGHLIAFSSTYGVYLPPCRASLPASCRDGDGAPHRLLSAMSRLMVVGGAACPLSMRWPDTSWCCCVCTVFAAALQPL